MKQYSFYINGISHVGDIKYVMRFKSCEYPVTSIFCSVVLGGYIPDMLRLLEFRNFLHVKVPTLEKLFEVYVMESNRMTITKQYDILTKFQAAGLKTSGFIQHTVMFVQEHSCGLQVMDLVDSLEIEYHDKYVELMDALNRYYLTGDLSQGLFFQVVFDDTVIRYSEIVSRE